jgi:preprotein translocase subunit YajC
MSSLLFVYIALFVAVFYLLAVRPQRRQRRAHQEMVTMLKKGDEIVTIGGLFGTVRKIGPDWVELEIANRTRVRFLKRAVSTIVSEEEDEEDEFVDDESEDTEAAALTAGDGEAEEADDDTDAADAEEEEDDPAAGDDLEDDPAAADEVEDDPAVDEESSESAANNTGKSKKMK